MGVTLGLFCLPQPGWISVLLKLGDHGVPLMKVLNACMKRVVAFIHWIERVWSSSACWGVAALCLLATFFGGTISEVVLPRLVVAGTPVNLIDMRWRTTVLRGSGLADRRRFEGSQGRPGGAVVVGSLEVSRVRARRDPRLPLWLTQDLRICGTLGLFCNCYKTFIFPFRVVW